MQARHQSIFHHLYTRLRNPARAAQESLYSKLKKFDYFDPSWYRLAYQTEIEFPDDLLWDYVHAGIQNGRDPSPYFNTTLYLRENELSPEQALLHFLKSGRDVASGAYRYEASLLKAQQDFLQGTETVVVSDDRTTTRPYAVYLQCGQGSLWDSWQPAQGRTWDLLVNHYDSSLTGRLPRDVELHQAGKYPGTKFTSFHNLLEEHPQLIERYEYILLLDDDVQFGAGDIDRLFTIVHQHGWDMAQASLTEDSSSSFPLFINPGKPGWRLVNGVELMMPIYSKRLLGLVKGLVGQSISGWGFDAALSMQAQQHGMKAAVVDDIIARHTRQINADIGRYYHTLHQAQIYPEIEFTHLQKKFGFTKPLFYEL